MVKVECANPECKNTFDKKKGTRQLYCGVKCLKKVDYIRNKQRYKDYEKFNRKEINMKKNIYYHNNKDKISKQRKEKYLKNPDYWKDRNKQYREANPEKVKKAKAEWFAKTKPQRNAKHRERYKTDELYRLSFNMRTRMRNFMKAKGWSKECETSQILGCDYKTLKKHLEKQFVKGMSWKNYGLWHIEHRKPLNSGKNVEEFYKLCHYKNLQPMWAEENLKKGAKLNYYSKKA